MLILFSVAGGSGGSSDISTGAVAVISAGIFLAIILTVFCISVIGFLSKLVMEVIKKRGISLPNADVSLAFLKHWRILGDSREKKDKPWKNTELETTQVCL